MKDPLFDSLKEIYRAHGYRLYIVGGTSRDLLLGRPFSDRDFVSDATPEEAKAFLGDVNDAFAKYGALKVRFQNQEIDVTTLRVEAGYQDYRHPGQIHFVKDPQQDYVRRDFTVNALYLDEDYQLLDYCGGYADLQAKLIRFIGDPCQRVKEDPLRILRAERFVRQLHFSLEEKTKEAIEENRYLLAKLNPAKVKEEERKG